MNKPLLLIPPLLLLGAVAPSLAAGHPGPAETSDDYVEFLGWTGDDVSYVYTKHVSVCSEGEAEGTGSVKVAVVRSGQTGATLKEFVIDEDSARPDDCERRKPMTPQEATALRKRIAALPKNAAFEQWRATNHLSCRQPRNNYGGQDLSASAEPKRADVHAHGRRTFLGFFFTGAGDPAHEERPKQITLKLFGNPSAEGPPSAVIRNLQIDGVLEGRVTVCMSANLRRIAWLVERFDASIRDFGEQFFHIGPGAGPRIQLLGRPAPPAAIVAQVDAELQKLELSLISTGVAPSAPATPMILVRSGLEAYAGRIAAQLPGSTIGPLNAKSAYDIVISFGAAPPLSPAAPAPAPAARP